MRTKASAPKIKTFLARVKYGGGETANIHKNGKFFGRE
jgi:hypothetical protein